MSEKYLEVYKALREGQSKYTYFILAAAGGAIVLSINQTQTAILAWTQIPLAVAVFCWGLSILFGCRNLGYVNASLRANAKILQIESGKDPEFGTQINLIEAAIAGIREAFESNSKRANTYGNLQFRFLILGAFFYIGWHILEMYLRGIIKS